MKKIIWVNYAACTPFENGPTRHFEIAKNLSLSGVSCTIVGSSIHHGSQVNRIKDNKKNLSQTVDGVRFHWVNSASGKKNILSRVISMLSFSMRLFKELLNPNLKADAFVGSSPHLAQAFITYCAAKKRKLPFYLEVRDIWPESLVEIGGFSRYHPGVIILRMAELFLYGRAKKIIAVLPGFEKYLQHNKISKEVLLAPNSPSVPLDNNDTPNLRQSDEFSFIYAGSHGLAQNLISILRAAKILQAERQDKIKIKFLGAGFEKPMLEKYANEHDLTNVEFINAVPKSAVSDIITASNAAILHLKKLPLFTWGISPNKLFDYMALGMPILFAVDTNYEPADKGLIGLKATPDDPEDLAKKMIEMSQFSEEKLLEMGDNGKKVVQKDNSFEVIAKNLAKEFNSL